MMRLILTTIMLTMLAQPVWAHQCILSGSTAEAIQSYNLCKADLVLDLLDCSDITVAAVKRRLWLTQVAKAFDQVVNKLGITRRFH